MQNFRFETDETRGCPRPVKTGGRLEDKPREETPEEMIRSLQRIFCRGRYPYWLCDMELSGWRKRRQAEKEADEAKAAKAKTAKDAGKR